MNKKQREYARSVFVELTHKMRQEDVARALGVDQTLVSRAKNSGATTASVTMAAAKLANRPQGEILAMFGFDAALESASSAAPSDWTTDPPILSFLSDLSELPGLRSWLRSKPELRLSQVAKIVDAWYTHPPKTDEDGKPHDGWEHFSHDILSGETVRRRAGNIRAAEKAEVRHLQHLRSTDHK